MTGASHKRDDLQWLRALAIIAVLCFHLWPKRFPYGYLGVDIFFVLSGYLMTMILSRNETILSFYLSRVKRIFPVCLFVITLFFIWGYFVLLPSHFEFLKSEAVWSIFFVNNFPSILHKKQYFELISDFKFFLHTWSLGVEIQFYLMAPFLIKFLMSRKSASYWIMAIITLSWLLQTFIPIEEISFGLVFCRIWQFMIGTFAYNATCGVKAGYCKLINNVDGAEEKTNAKVKEEKVPKNYANLSYVTFLCLTVICFLPYSLTQFTGISTFLRLICTALAGIFVGLSSVEQLHLPSYLSSLLVYIGNASFVIYLIHWPIITFFQYFNITYGYVFTLACIISSSVLILECFEKPLIKRAWIWNGAIIAFCYVIIISLLSTKLENLTLDYNAMDPIKANEYEYESCKVMYYNSSCLLSPLLEKYLTIRPVPITYWDRYCVFKLNSSTNKTAVVTGNSFAFFQIRGILDGIKASKMEFSEVFLISYPGCSILAGNNYYSRDECKVMKGSHDAFLEILRPDLIIHTARYEHLLPSRNLPFAEDEYYQEFKESILHVANYTRQLIIIEPHPNVEGKKFIDPSTVALELKNKESLEDFKITFQEHRTRHDASWSRVKEASKHCSNCKIIPTEHLFCEAGFCSIVDKITKISMYCDRTHITSTTSLLFTPLLIKAIDENLIG